MHDNLFIFKVVWFNSLVVAQIYDLELLHVAHLLWQRLQLVGMKEQHSCILPITHLQGERMELCEQTHAFTQMHGRAHCTGFANLEGKLDKVVVICSKGAYTGALANGGGQSFDLIEAAVQFIQRCQPDKQEGLNNLNIGYL